MLMAAVQPPTIDSGMVSEMMVTVPDGVSAGQTIQVNTPSGQAFKTVVPEGLLPGQQFKLSLQQPAAAPGTIVAGQNEGLAPGAWDGGAIGQMGTASAHVSNAIGNHHIAGTQPQKVAGNATMVPCSACGAHNAVKMVMGTRAQFTCGQCGVVVIWRPRQIWLRDQGLPMEKPIHPQPGETDGMGCCVIL